MAKNYGAMESHDAHAGGDKAEPLMAGQDGDFEETGLASLDTRRMYYVTVVRLLDGVKVRFFRTELAILHALLAQLPSLFCSLDLCIT